MTVRANLTVAALVFCFTLAIHAADAAQYFVSPTGNDTASGTSIGTPLKTIQRAVQLAGPDDSVEVRAGTYREQVELSQSRCGTDGHPMLIDAYHGEAVSIKGSDVVAGWVNVGGAVWQKTGWTVNSQQVFVDGKPLRQIGSQCPFQIDKQPTGDANDKRLPSVGSGLGDMVPGSFYYDGTAQTLDCELSDRSNPNAHLVEASVRHTVLNGWGKSFIHLSGLTVMHCNGTSEGDFAGLVQFDGSGWVIDHCTFEYGDFSGIRMSGDHHIIRNCRVLDNGDSGINLTGSDAAHGYGEWPDRPSQHIVLSNLTIAGNNYRKFDEYWHAGGIKAIPSVRGVVVRDCTVTDNGGAGIWFDTVWGDITIEGNYCARNTVGIMYEVSKPATGDPFGAVIRNNRIVQNRDQGIYVSASSGASVVGNTCYQNNYDIVLHGMPRFDGTAPYHLQNNTVTGNIVDGNQRDVVIFTGDNSSNNIFDGNYYVSDSDAITMSTTDNSGYNITVRDLPSAREKLNYEQHGVVGPSPWLGGSTGDFRLNKKSVAVGKGWQPEGAHQ